MSIEAGIGEKAEKAIGEKKDKPDLSSVFDDWKNNTSKAENQAERKSINDAVHKHLPNVTIIDFGAGKTPTGEAKYVETYDSSTHKLEVRKVEDFSVVKSQDLTNELKANKITDEKAIQMLTEKVDNDKDAASKTAGKPDGRVDKPEVANPNDSAKPTDPAAAEVKPYVVQSGDNLWKIAKREIAEANKANGKPDSMPSPNEVKAFIEKIVLANQTGDGAIKNANLIYAGKTLNIPVEVAPAQKKDEIPTAKKEEVPAEEKDDVPTAKKDETPAEKKEEVPTVKKEDPAAEKKEEIEVKPASANTATDNTTPNATSNPASDAASDMFIPKSNTYYNPTIGSEEASRESAALNKFYEQMRELDGSESGKAYVTAAEINKFVETNKSHLPRTDGQPVPNAEEIELLERAAKNVGRIASSSDDEMFFESSGATRKDVQVFAEQEKDFEGRFQARFYLDKHFDRLTAGQDHISVSEIKAYREQLATRANSEAEVKAVDNVLVQLGKQGYKDGSVLFRDNAKASIRDEVAGSKYGEYGGRNYPIPQVAAK